LRVHLAGEDHALGGFVGAQGIVDIFAEAEAAGFAGALAGTAGAVAAIDGNIDTLAVGRIGHGFSGLAVDEAGDAIFEIQGDSVGHGCLRLGRSMPRSGQAVCGSPPGLPFC